MKSKNAVRALALAVLAMGFSSEAPAKNAKSISLTQIGRYSAGGGIERAEIAAYDPATRRIFAINPTASRVEVLDVSDPGLPELEFTIALIGRPNSVAVKNGVVAVAVENAPKTSFGWVQFFDVDGNSLSTITVGSLPDMVAFTPNGHRLLVANEGEPNSYNQANSVDPEGTVSIIDMTVGAVNLTDADVRTAKFSDAIPKVNLESIRKYGPNATLAQDLEPEYITVSHDSRTAWVTLQENNAIAILDIEKGVSPSWWGSASRTTAAGQRARRKRQRNQQLAEKWHQQHRQLAGLRHVSAGRQQGPGTGGHRDR